MKTAISVPDELFNEVEKVAKEHHYSRSEVFVLALREYFEKRKARKLLVDLNEAYGTAETTKDYTVRLKGKKRYATNTKKERF